MEGEFSNTKATFRIAAGAKHHRNRPRRMSDPGAANRVGRTMHVTIIACWANRANERPGLKAHRTLAPAKARYAKRQMRWEGKGLGRRERCCSALATEIAAITGQNILVSMRSSYGGSLRSVYSNGEMIV